jgi:ribosome-associated protein
VKRITTDRVRQLAEAALERKGRGVLALSVGELTSFADTFLLVSGSSDRQVRAIADAVVEAAKAAGDAPLGVEGYDEGHWVLIDLNDVIVHVFLDEVREHYDLERLWADATSVEFGPPEPDAERRSAP